MPDLRANTAGIESPNPFWLASAPPTNSGRQIMRAFEAEGIEEATLEDALEGTGAESGVVALLRELVLGGVGELDPLAQGEGESRHHRVAGPRG